MKTRVTRIRLPDLVLMVVVAGAVALVAIITACEADLGDQAAAGVGATPTDQDSPAQEQESGGGDSPEPMALTLSAPSICETLPAQEYAGARWVTDEDGNRRVEYTSSGWSRINEVSVSWSVSGGTAPYTLGIDGESRDASGAYEGATGTASVSCAQRFSGAFFEHLEEEHRRYRTEPEVDSGLKTIRATVTDGTGATTEGSIDVYVIVELGGSGSVLNRGKTYRVFGHLITAPADYDVRVGSVTEPDCTGVPASERCGPEFSLDLLGTGAYLSLFMTDGAEGIRRNPTGAQGSTDTIDAAFDALVDSVNRRPSTGEDRQ